MPGRKRRKKTGRPTKFTAERRTKFLEGLAAGNTRRASCLAAGFSEDTFQRAVARDAAFAAEVKKAEAQAESEMVAVIRKAAITTWQAAAWWLERRLFNDWALKSRHEHTGAGGGPIKWDLSSYSDEELAQLERLRLKGEGKA